MTTTSEDVRPFRIEFPQAALDDLNDRLDRARWPDELSATGWAYGVPGSYLRELARYWRHEYDWRAAEARLNEWPQYVTTVDGARLHFAHVRSPEADATPLVMTHGWPGSIVEFAHVVGPLTDPRAHGGDPSGAFHVIMPSIPGFGLSGPTTETGWDFRRVASAVAELMRRLGYRRYGVQGGDWGAVISRELGRTRPASVIGVHLNLLPGAIVTQEPDSDELALLTPAERERTIASWRRSQQWAREQRGYADIQSTRPQTLAYALTDSPVGQLAWIAEKFKEWTDSRDRPEDAVDRDQLLTNVTLYWLTGTAGSSARLYYESAHDDHPQAPHGPSSAPNGFGGLPPGELHPPAAPRRTHEQHRAVDRVPTRRPILRDGTTSPARHRHPKVLPPPRHS